MPKQTVILFWETTVGFWCNALDSYRIKTAFLQLKEISFKMTITLGGGVSINCIYYSIFSKLLCLFFCQIPSPYHDSHMQINCGSPVSRPSAIVILLCLIITFFVHVITGITRGTIGSPFSEG